MTPDKVVKMANQIGASVPDPSRAPQQTAAHLRTFWAPSMIAELERVATLQPERLTPVVHTALASLRPTEPARG